MKYNGFETNDKAGLFPHRHSEQGLSLPETMVTKEEVLDGLETLNTIAHLNLHGAVKTLQFEIIETLKKFIDKQQ